MGEWIVPKHPSISKDLSLLNDWNLYSTDWDSYSANWESYLNVNNSKVWTIFYGSSILFFLFGFVININRISLHNFYKDKITETYIFKRKKQNETAQNADNVGNDDEIVYDDKLLLKGFA